MPGEREDFPVARVAALARLRLSPAEEALYQTQLTHVLQFVSQVAAAALGEPAGCAGANRMPAVERPDGAGPSLPPGAALANAPDVPGAARLVRVPKVMG